MKAVKKYYPLFLPPLLTLAVMLYVFKNYNMYPFGQGSIAWCDMNQQGIPLLMDFKDMLSGKDNLFFSMNNAGGMSFWGVFCFFLSNPFSLLSVFVPKEEIIYFVNIIVILKLTLCSFTAAIYFRCCKKPANGAVIVSLSLMYALCGYGMLFYQNIMWLDVMYLFPVLMIGLEKLTKERKNIVFIISLSAITIMNFYLCYMVVVFILLYMTVWFISERQSEYHCEVCIKFLSGSVLAAMITAVVWLPSLIQVMSSGRLGSVSGTINSASFLSHYESVLPLLFCTGFIFVVLLMQLLSREKKTKEHRRNLLLFLLTVIPFFIEPVNIMWHTGNYMSFPARYGLITIFIGLICCADLLTDSGENISEKKLKIQYILIPLPFALIYGYYFISQKMIDKDFETLTKYTATLWGKKESLDGLARLFVISVLCYLIILLLYRKRLIMKRVFAIMLVTLCCVEGMNSIRLYMVSPAENNPKGTTDFASLSEMSDKIQDDDFYRVKTDFKAADYNMTGALGYPSVSHYTSLTDHDFMVMQRLLGYSTVWMKSGSTGGTELTNALYCIKYNITEGKATDHTIYTNGRYSINSISPCLGLGILCSSDFSGGADIPDGMTRAEIQQYLFENIFDTDKKLITEYDYDKKKSTGIFFSNNKYQLSGSAKVKYDIDVSRRQSLYADCYDRFSNSLSEDYFEGLCVKVNGRTIKSKYPEADANGLLKLGEYENEKITVEITANKKISCYSFGIFGLDLDMLSEAIDNTSCADLRYNGSKIIGNVRTDSNKTCLLSIPYNDGLIVKLNGNKVPVKKVLSDLTAFELPAGENRIEIYLIPKGFIAGIIITVIGIVLLVVYIRFRSKIHIPKKVSAAVDILTGFAAVCGVMMVYIAPIILALKIL